MKKELPPRKKPNPDAYQNLADVIMEAPRKKQALRIGQK